MPPDLVWYVAYGSNRRRERFLLYLRGGQAPGRSRVEPGARNPAPPLADEACVIDHALGFQGWSKWWRGGVCFVDPNPTEAATLCRRYLITGEQFSDVLAQESGRPVGDDVDLSEVLSHGDAVVGPGKYDRALLLDTVDDVPMVTFTTSTPVDELEFNAPSEAYAATIVRGLMQTHGLGHDEARTYITERWVAWEQWMT